MSSPEEDYNDDFGQNAKKRRIQRACDMCRRKKSDAAQMAGNRCSNCVSYRLECTYVEAAKKRGPPKGYVESLETRLEKMENLLNKLCPNADFSKELGGSFDRDGWTTDRGDALGGSGFSIPTTPGPGTISSPPALSSSAGTPSHEADEFDPSDDEIVAQRTIVQNLKKMSVNPSSMRYHGKSSSLLFIQTAMDLKHEYAGVEMPNSFDPDAPPAFLRRRQQYWSLHPWLTSNVQDEHSPHKDFPPADLLATLVDLYFTNVNDYMPLLHRPTLEQGIREGMHLHDEGFGSTVLLVCANGSRFTDDPRVLLDGNEIPQSAGWKWFQQVQMVRKSLLAPPRLYDLQIYALTAEFLQGTSAPQACWTIIGIGIRMAQDVGAHRKKVYSSTPTIEEELWRRAFWSLVAMDRTTSFSLGRPCAIQDEDFDADLPTECDDEYWVASDAGPAFKQPPGTPSKITFFNCFVRLHQILAFAMRTIYSINKSKALLGFVGQQWEQHIVAELDSALNKWIDSVPDHLRWDPTRENVLFLNQSAVLFAHYYQLQIAVHRPFIPSPRKPSPLSFPSLAICTNAARSCIHVLDIQHGRSGKPIWFCQMALFTAGIVLLLNIWGGKRSGLSTDPAKEMADVHKCMKMLRILEPQWHTAGRLWDILYELASVGDLPLPQASPAPSQKRERDSDTPMSTSATPLNAVSPPPPPPPLPPPANAATPPVPLSTLWSSTRRQKDGPSLAAQTFAAPVSARASAAAPSSEAGSSAFTLPLHTEELGRMPLHPGFSGTYTSNWHQHQHQQQQQQQQRQQQQQQQAHVPFDPRMVTMYTSSGFADMFGGGEPSAFASGTPAGAGSGVGPDMQAMAAAGAGAGAPPEMTSEELAFANGTLAMWSSAPHSFEWDDWGTYINSVSGMQNPGAVGPHAHGGPGS
ncbi:fungal-specific transcription factor domain-containing protein [Epithele typhae]|uniref:fungal-specific transcription factor domain-containing protein n=1 Tax=Epithele typhae TaxID=378194 RepID=UPI002007631B|nr:fungal-specific transcription factor domain-containing protein [Epithele typhae]KAH9910329.1 fungal-specific transcription factor domain-containing protein [Epithele typhae]